MRRGIDRDARCFFEVHAVHVGGFDVRVDARGLRCGDGLKRYGADSGFAHNGLVEVHEKSPAPIIEQPFHGMALLQGPKRNAVGFEVIGLRHIHRDEHLADIDLPPTNRRRANRG